MAVKFTKSWQNILNGHKIYQHSPLQYPPKYPNWYFWYENVPSGKPGKQQETQRLKFFVQWRNVPEKISGQYIYFRQYSLIKIFSCFSRVDKNKIFVPADMFSTVFC
jgi:hypothetical protein